MSSMNHERKVKTSAFFALALVIFVSALALGLGVLSSAVRAQEDESRCPVMSQPLDEGYGVTEAVARSECLPVGP